MLYYYFMLIVNNIVRSNRFVSSRLKSVNLVHASNSGVRHLNIDPPLRRVPPFHPHNCHHTIQTCPSKDRIASGLKVFPWEDGWEFLASEIVMFLPLEDNQGDILDTFKLQRKASPGLIFSICILCLMEW